MNIPIPPPFRTSAVEPLSMDRVIFFNHFPHACPPFLFPSPFDRIDPTSSCLVRAVAPKYLDAWFEFITLVPEVDHDEGVQDVTEASIFWTLERDDRVAENHLANFEREA